jgi:hypothetical protein
LLPLAFLEYTGGGCGQPSRIPVLMNYLIVAASPDEQ